MYWIATGPCTELVLHFTPASRRTDKRTRNMPGCRVIRRHAAGGKTKWILFVCDSMGAIIIPRWSAICADGTSIQGLSLSTRTAPHLSSYFIFLGFLQYASPKRACILTVVVQAQPQANHESTSQTRRPTALLADQAAFSPKDHLDSGHRQRIPGYRSMHLL
jgi:hypothetical protein